MTDYSIILFLLQRQHFFLLNSSLCLPSAFSVIFTRIFSFCSFYSSSSSSSTFSSFSFSYCCSFSSSFSSCVSWYFFPIYFSTSCTLHCYFPFLLLCLFLLRPHILTCGNTRPVSARITNLYRHIFSYAAPFCKFSSLFLICHPCSLPYSN